jgi:hypothetical protein
VTLVHYFYQASHKIPAVVMVICRVLKDYFDAQVPIAMLFSLYGIREGGKVQLKCDGTR